MIGTFFLYLRSLVFNTAVLLDTIAMCFVMLWTMMLPRRFIMMVARTWLRQVAWIERHIGGIDYRVVGREYIPDSACIIAAKHQSVWETFKYTPYP